MSCSINILFICHSPHSENIPVTDRTGQYVKCSNLSVVISVITTHMLFFHPMYLFFFTLYRQLPNSLLCYVRVWPLMGLMLEKHCTALPPCLLGSALTVILHLSFSVSLSLCVSSLSYTQTLCLDFIAVSKNVSRKLEAIPRERQLLLLILFCLLRSFLSLNANTILSESL